MLYAQAVEPHTLGLLKRLKGMHDAKTRGARHVTILIEIDKFYKNRNQRCRDARRASHQ
jgi:hypothetical protein